MKTTRPFRISYRLLEELTNMSNINRARIIALLILPIPIPAFVFGILYLVYSAYMAKKGNDNIGHDAHFWGAVYGVVFTIFLKPSLLPAFFIKITGFLH